jgi:hypothetical protein
VSPDELPEPDFLYEVARHRLDLQLEFIDALDNKTGVLFSVGSAEVAIVAAFLVIHPELVRSLWLLLLVGALAYFGLGLAAILGLWSRKWDIGPKLDDLAALYEEGLSEDEVKRQATHALDDCWKENQPAFKYKTWRLRAALLAVAAQTTVALAAVVVEAVR